MSGTLFEWSIQFGLSLFDFVQVYVLAHALTRVKVKVNLLHISLGLIYALVMTPIYFLFGGYVFRIIGILLLVFGMKWITKRNLSDWLVIHAIFLVIGVFAQFLPFFMLSLSNLNSWLISLFTQMISTGILIGICKKFKLNKIFNAVQALTALKLVLFFLALLILFFFFIVNFEWSIPYFLLFALVSILIGLALSPVLIKLYYQSIGMISVHDLKNSLLSMGVTMDDMDFSTFKEKFKTMSKQFGMDLKQLDISRLEAEMDDEKRMTHKVKEFIRMKSTLKSKEIEIITDVAYHKDCENMDIQIALEWLGTLLDNALEATFNQPIYVRLFSSTRRFSIQVANEYLGDKGNDIRRIFEKGYSTKGEGRGIGLHLLHEKVIAQDGIIEVDEYYSDEHNCHYLQITILIKKKRQPF